MKKIIVALVALFFAFSANAQIGIMAGITSSASDVKSAVSDIQNVNQYHVGVAYKLGIGNLLTIQPAILYNMKGTRIGDVGGINDLNVDYKTGYLEVPVQVQVGFGLGPIARVFAFAEPFVGYAITNTIDTNGVSVKAWDNIKNKIDYGVGLGVGAEVLKHVQFSVKYFWNMGKVYGADVELGDVTNTIAESSANGVAASVAFFF